MKKITYLILLTVLCFPVFSQEPNMAEPDVRQIKILEELSLPVPSKSGDFSLEQVLNSVSGVDEFTDDNVSLEGLSQLLWAGQGVIDSNLGTGTVQFKDRNSPVKLYIVVKNGSYVYQPDKNVILKMSGMDIRRRLSMSIGANRGVVRDAPCNIIVAGKNDGAAKIGSYNSKRMVYLLGGQVVQNIQLQAISIGLGAYIWPVFDQSAVTSALEMGSDEEALCMISIGYPVAEQKAVLKQLPKEKAGEEGVEGGESYRVVMIIPDEMIADRQFYGTYDALSIADMEIEVAAISLGRYETDRRGWIDPTMLLRDLNISDFDAVLLVSGRRVRGSFRNIAIEPIIREAAESNKVIGAIGRSVEVLGDSGIVNGYRLTGDESIFNAMRGAGAIFTNGDVERDRNIVTAKSSEDVAHFARLIAEALRGRQSIIGGMGRYVDPRVLEKRGQMRDETRRGRRRY